jgi:hypothetical protein
MVIKDPNLEKRALIYVLGFILVVVVAIVVILNL